MTPFIIVKGKGRLMVVKQLNFSSILIKRIKLFFIFIIGSPIYNKLTCIFFINFKKPFYLPVKPRNGIITYLDLLSKSKLRQNATSLPVKLIMGQYFIHVIHLCCSMVLIGINYCKNNVKEKTPLRRLLRVNHLHKLF